MNDAATTPAIPAIEITGLSHHFKQHKALDGVTFSVSAGQLHGFVGPNGAGKTTTLKVLSTLLPPQRGVVKVFGREVSTHQREVRKSIGFMPDHFGMYRHMTVQEYLDFFGAAYGLSPSQRQQTISDILELTDMAGRRDDLIQGLSRGMQQRVSLARVLVNDPKLLLLDEPASGLDPRARIELMEILKELQRLGKTVFISSHILSELALLCDSCTIIDRGQIRYTGSMQGLLERRGDRVRYELRIAEPREALGASLEGVAGISAVEATEDGRRCWIDADPATLNPNDIFAAAMACGAVVTGFREQERHLNEAFMELTEAGVRT